MDYKTILVLLHGTDADGLALDCALGLARAFGARVEGVAVRPDPRETVQLATDGMSPAMIESIMAAGQAETEQRLEHARASFATACEAAGLAIGEDPSHVGLGAGWTESIGDPAEHVARRGRLSDLVVLGHPAAAEAEGGYAEVEAGLFESGRPILIVGGTAYADPTAPVVVGWNGSAESARAVAGALPLLQRSSTVSVVAVGEPEGFHPSAGELCAYLARHGVQGHCYSVEAEGRPIGTCLMDEAERLNAGLVVMGAYGHSRLREFVLGGVTRRVLGSPGMSLLMAR